MAFYRLVCPDKGENILMKRVSHRAVSSVGGEALSALPADAVFEIEMHAGEESGYDQFDPDFEGEVEAVPVVERLRDYYRLPALMTPRLVSALRAAGADNLQTFPVRVRDVATGEPLGAEYLFVNIVGRIACASLAGSEHDELGESRVFHELRIDPEAVGEALIFRLAESPVEVIVHERLARTIRDGGFAGLTVEAVS